jgi:hypothetical protein
LFTWKDRELVIACNFVNDLRLEDHLKGGEESGRGRLNRGHGGHGNNPGEIGPVTFKCRINHQRLLAVGEMDQGSLIGNLHFLKGRRRYESTIAQCTHGKQHQPNQAHSQSHAFHFSKL